MSHIQAAVCAVPMRVLMTVHAAATSSNHCRVILRCRNLLQIFSIQLLLQMLLLDVHKLRERVDPSGAAARSHLFTLLRVRTAEAGVHPGCGRLSMRNLLLSELRQGPRY